MTTAERCNHEHVRLIWQMNPVPAAVECLNCHARWRTTTPVVHPEPAEVEPEATS